MVFLLIFLTRFGHKDNEQIQVPNPMQGLGSSLKDLFSEYANEDDIDGQFQILLKINTMLPESKRLRIPSLVTHDYIRKVLLEIEEDIEETRT